MINMKKVVYVVKIFIYFFTNIRFLFRNFINNNSAIFIFIIKFFKIIKFKSFFIYFYKIIKLRINIIKYNLY